MKTDGGLQDDWDDVPGDFKAALRPGWTYFRFARLKGK